MPTPRKTTSKTSASAEAPKRPSRAKSRVKPSEDKAARAEDSAKPKAKAVEGEWLGADGQPKEAPDHGLKQLLRQGLGKAQSVLNLDDDKRAELEKKADTVVDQVAAGLGRAEKEINSLEKEALARLGSMKEAVAAKRSAGASLGDTLGAAFKSFTRKN